MNFNAVDRHLVSLYKKLKLKYSNNLYYILNNYNIQINIYVSPNYITVTISKLYMCAPVALCKKHNYKLAHIYTYPITYAFIFGC